MNKKFNVSKLKQAIKEKGFTIEEFAKKLDMTGSGFHYSVKKGTFSIKDLEMSLDILGKNVSCFFDETDNSGVSIQQTHSGNGDNNMTLDGCREELHTKDLQISRLQADLIEAQRLIIKLQKTK